jgi:hypothetical protein
LRRDVFVQECADMPRHRDRLVRGFHSPPPG